MRTIIVVLLLLALVGCSSPNPTTPFETGEIVETPYGCKKAQEEGRDVDC